MEREVYVRVHVPRCEKKGIGVLGQGGRGETCRSRVELYDAAWRLQGVRKVYKLSNILTVVGLSKLRSRIELSET